MGQLISGAWTLEQSDVLKMHIADGLSYAASAVAINRQFGTTYTRNSAIGRANRIGLAAPARPKAEPKPRKPSGHRVREKYNAGAKRIMPAFESVDAIQLRCVEIVPRNLTLADLERGDGLCRYPYGDGPFTFCGHPSQAGSSYCVPHFHLCRETPRIRRQVAI